MKRGSAGMAPIVPVTHVIFDLDGLLVDTERCYTLANHKCLQVFGKEFTMELKAGQMGMPQYAAIEFLLKAVGIHHQISVLEYEKDYNKYLFESFAEADAKEGAERLAVVDVPMAICTGSSKDDYPAKTARHRAWLDLIPLVVLTGTDAEVKHGKPHPDAYLVTCQRLPHPPSFNSSVLVFEDAPNGVTSALAAGTQVPTGPEPCFRMGAEIDKQITVLPSLKNFDPVPFGLPPFDD